MKAIVVLAVLLASVYGRAINIFGSYVAPGGDIYGVQSQAAPTLNGGGTLGAIFNTAASSWNSKIGDTWNLEIKYGWSNSIGNALAEYTGWWMPFGDLRHFQARILFNPNYSWFADPTPTDHSEYQTYRETTKNYGSGPINIGKNYTNATGAAAGRFDLLSVATHEIGHALSIGVGPRWFNEVSDGDIDVTAPRQHANSTVIIDNAQNHLADQTALMWYGTAAGERKLISDLDLESGMQLSGFVVQSVPEPTSIAAFLAGLALLARQRKNR